MADEEELSMRDSIEAAITTLGDDSGMEPAPHVEPTPGEPIEARDAEGQTAEAKKASETPAGETFGESKAGEARSADDTARRSADDEQNIGDVTKPPVSWTPAAREGWDSIPEPIRQQITKREQEMNTALDEGKDNRKRGEQFHDIANRYAQVIAAEGVTDPIQGFEEMMKVMAQLRMGTPQQKAEKIAQFIGGYGVPIEILDNILSGQPAGQHNGAEAQAGIPGQQYIDEKLAPVNQLLSRLNAQERQQNLNRNQAYMAEVVAFKAANEFYTDVQNDMADLCEMAGKRGYDMPLAEAYTKACAMNPEISKVMTDRAATANLAAGGKVLTSKRNASSSLMSGQQQGVPATEDMDLRETLSAAWDAQTG